jgi:hypothetical protein
MMHAFLLLHLCFKMLMCFLYILTLGVMKCCYDIAILQKECCAGGVMLQVLHSRDFEFHDDRVVGRGRAERVFNFS